MLSSAIPKHHFKRDAKASVALNESGRVEYGSFLFSGETARYYHLPFGVT
jgi:hypothetical protein